MTDNQTIHTINGDRRLKKTWRKLNRDQRREVLKTVSTGETGEIGARIAEVKSKQKRLFL